MTFGNGRIVKKWVDPKAQAREERKARKVATKKVVKKEAKYDDERGLRMMEEWAAYQYAGCTQAFWDDLAAGYIN